MKPIIHRFPEVSSTQDEARRLIEVGRARVGHVVLADRQRDGRGRFGRAWCSPAGGLYATFLASNGRLVSLEAGVVVAEALGDRGIAVGLKWPNDLLLDDGKLGGILVETADGIALIGIGLNLTESPLETATSLAEHGMAIAKGDLILALWRVLHRERSDDEILEAHRRRSATLGRRVSIEMAAGRSIEGVAADIDLDGRLVVETADGTCAIASGECIHALGD